MKIGMNLLAVPVAALVLALVVASSGGGDAKPDTGGDDGDDEDPVDDSLPEGEVDGDNWGSTPESIRPLFMRMEEVLNTPGAGRFFAVVSYIESRFVPTAHNDSEGEVDASDRAWKNNSGHKPYLKYATEARAFGSGGLFGQLAPYFLWSATPEMKDKAPLLDKKPEAIFQPKLAAYGAVVLLRRILTNYRVDDLLDARVGWGGVGYLGDLRGSKTYNDIRARYVAGAEKVGIDLSKLPPKLIPGPWIGYEAAFAAMTEE